MPSCATQSRFSKSGARDPARQFAYECDLSGRRVSKHVESLASHRRVRAFFPENRTEVRRDLEDLLNTRRRNLVLPAGLAEIGTSLLAYGVPDFSGAGPAADIAQRFNAMAHTLADRDRRIRHTAMRASDQLSVGARGRDRGLLAVGGGALRGMLHSNGRWSAALRTSGWCQAGERTSTSASTLAAPPGKLVRDRPPEPATPAEVTKPASEVPEQAASGCPDAKGEPKQCTTNEECCSGFVCSLDPERSHIVRYCLEG